MSTSEAQKRATRKYCDAHYDRLNLQLPRGEREIMRAAADAVGQSLNAYCLQAIRARMKAEGAADLPGIAGEGPEDPGPGPEE